MGQNQSNQPNQPRVYHVGHPALARASAEAPQLPADGFADIFFAAKTANIEHLTFFIEEVKVSANIKDAHGTSALQWAVLSNKAEPVLYLLSHGADLDLASAEGQKIWSTCKNVEIRNLLLSTCRCSNHELYLEMAGVKPARVAVPPVVASRPVNVVAPPAPVRQLPAPGPQPQMMQPLPARQPQLNIPPIQAAPLPQVPVGPIFSNAGQQQPGLVYYLVPPQEVGRFVSTLRAQNANVVWVGDAPQQMISHMPAPQPQQQQQQFYPMAPEQTFNQDMPYQMPQADYQMPLQPAVSSRPVDLLL